jgi:hypothetical protein
VARRVRHIVDCRTWKLALPDRFRERCRFIKPLSLNNYFPNGTQSRRRNLTFNLVPEGIRPRAKHMRLI